MIVGSYSCCFCCFRHLFVYILSLLQDLLHRIAFSFAIEEEVSITSAVEVDELGECFFEVDEHGCSYILNAIACEI